MIRVTTVQSAEVSAVECFSSPSTLWWPLIIDTGLVQVMFITQSQNATVIEGGDATFQCAAEENGIVLLFGWNFTPKGGMVTTVTTGTTVARVSMVMVSGDCTQLTSS